MCVIQLVSQNVAKESSYDKVHNVKNANISIETQGNITGYMKIVIHWCNAGPSPNFMPEKI